MFKQYYIPIFISLTTKLLILIFIPLLLIYIKPEFKMTNIWETWNIWDSRHYVDIATLNYHRASNDEAVLIGFLPFLPLMMYIFKFIFHTSILVSGYIVSAVSTVLLSVILYKLVLLDYSKKIAYLTILMLFIFPTSFFLHIPFTESLFLLLVISAFYFVRKKYYWLSFLCIGLATFTKVAGLSLILAIFIEILFYQKEFFKKKNIYKWIYIILGLLISASGFLIFLYINYYVWGDPLYFTIVQKKFIFESFAPFGQGLVNAVNASLNRVGPEKFMIGYAQWLAFLLGLVMSLYTLIKIRISYGVYMLLTLWFSYSLSLWLSMPRHIITLFPMFIILSLFSKNILFKYTWILLSVSLLVVFATIFIQWGPVL